MSTAWLILIGAGAATAWATTRPEWVDRMKGGLADKRKPSDFDQKQLRKGIRVEREHTGDNTNLATEIAMDHLTEDPRYYDKLERIEDQNRGQNRGQRRKKRR
jgi:hypothetical protein